MKTSVKVCFIPPEHKIFNIVSMFFNCFFLYLSLFVESLTPPDSLPVDIQQDDPSNFSNITRSDANCDKTGTCYDGKD